MKQVKLGKHQAGFTIIELMISTMVFGTVLLVVTTAILQITRVYYKGITQANTQSVARNITDLVSQGIQFNGGDVTETPGPNNAFCVGGQQYSFVLGKQLADGTPTAAQTHHALVVADRPGCTASTPGSSMNTAATTGRELLQPNMRLSKMSVENIGTNLYKVTVKVVSGDDDILTNPTTAAATCQNVTAGTQFCAESELTTVVTKRVE
ncbi:MAG TPA: prepilin-type N-terminal cleavage/methylation domain-containing protein [Candidatus Saccharimonadales bacterium]|nr:prepilin-type N-terminal cleavage/methylation domain-containing protein [Candidatus Saccharimonadales bacterium]